MGNTFTINYDICFNILLIYCLLIACKVVIVVVKLIGRIMGCKIWSWRIPYQVFYRTNVTFLSYILLIMCFYDWSIYNPTNTCVLIYFIQCKNSQVLKATLSVLTCEVYFSWVSSWFCPDKPVCFLFILDNT